MQFIGGAWVVPTSDEEDQRLLAIKQSGAAGAKLIECQEHNCMGFVSVCGQTRYKCCKWELKTSRYASGSNPRRVSTGMPPRAQR